VQGIRCADSAASCTPVTAPIGVQRGGLQTIEWMQRSASRPQRTRANGAVAEREGLYVRLLTGNYVFGKLAR
jgi:hypothetical protein